MPLMLKRLNPLLSLPREIYILSIANVINRTGTFVSIFFTLYLTQVLNFSAQTTGFIVTLYSIVCMLGTAVGGKLGDHINRKSFIVFTRVSSGTLVAISGFILHSPITIILLFISGFVKYADRPVNNAIVIDLTNSENRKKSISLLYLSDNLGIAVGSSIAGFLYSNYINWVFWGDAFTTLVAISLIFLFIPQLQLPNKQNKQADTKETEQEQSIFRLVFSKTNLVFFTLVIIFEKFIYTQQSFALPLYVKSILQSSGEYYYGYLMSFNCIIVLIFTNILFMLTKNLSSLVNIVIGSAFYGIGFGMLYFAKFSAPIPIFFISTFLWTLGEILNATNQNVYIANNSPPDYRSRFSGFFHVFMGVGKSLCPLISGLFIAFFGLVNIWIIVFVAAILLILCTVFILFTENNKLFQSERIEY